MMTGLCPKSCKNGTLISPFFDFRREISLGKFRQVSGLRNSTGGHARFPEQSHPVRPMPEECAAVCATYNVSR